MLYQKPGSIDWKSLEAANIGLEEIIRHFVLVQVRGPEWRVGHWVSTPTGSKRLNSLPAELHAVKSPILRPSPFRLPCTNRAAVAPSPSLQEYLWQVLDTDDVNGKGVSVIDVAGLSVTGGGNNTEFLKSVLALLGEHYPERARHIFIVNAPFGFSTLWTVISRFVDPVRLTESEGRRRSSYFFACARARARARACAYVY